MYMLVTSITDVSVSSCVLSSYVYTLQLDTAQKELHRLSSGTSAELDSEKRSKAALQRRVAELDAKVIYIMMYT
jgi:hypothetical protein